MTTIHVETPMQSEICPSCMENMPRLNFDRRACLWCGCVLQRVDGRLVAIGSPPIVSTAEIEAVKKGARAAQGARS